MKAKQRKKTHKLGIPKEKGKVMDYKQGSANWGLQVKSGLWPGFVQSKVKKMVKLIPNKINAN